MESPARLGKSRSFDIVVAVILGSILSRAVTANARFLPTLAAAGVLMVLHFILGRMALHSPPVGYLVKGGETELVKNGQIQWDALRHANVTPHDLREAARLKGVLDFQQFHTAYLERNGSISVFKSTEEES